MSTNQNSEMSKLYNPTCGLNITKKVEKVEKVENSDNINNVNSKYSDSNKVDIINIVETDSKKVASKKKKKIRCNICRKKLHLHTLFTCGHCGVITCSVHRYMDEHKCVQKNNVIEEYKKQLIKSLPTCIASKLEKF